MSEVKVVVVELEIGTVTASNHFNQRSHGVLFSFIFTASSDGELVVTLGCCEPSLH